MIYFDNGATTMVCSEAADACTRSFKNFGNPSSQHSVGLAAKKDVKDCAGVIERILNADEGTFYFTSGATEANNWAIFGTAQQNVRRGRHIITSKTEHPSVLEPFSALCEKGFDVSYISVDKKGKLDLDELCASIRDDTVLLSVMHVNNETGIVNDIKSIGDRVKTINKNTIFHVDGVCSFCKIPVDLRRAKVDLFSVSGHKLHAPKGVGGLYVRKGTKLAPLILGGGQQNNMRSGTESTSLIAAFAAAAMSCRNEMELSLERVGRLKEKLREGILRLNGEINGELDNSSPYILNAGFRGIKSQVLLNALEQRDIYVSAGSACNSNKKSHSKPLMAMGVDEELIEGSVRFSFSKFNTENEVEYCLGALSEILDKYRGHK